MRKRLIWLIITGPLGCNLLFAQNVAIDSLKDSLVDHSQLDTTTVNLLNTLAMEVRRIDRKQMIPYTEEALVLSKKLNYEKGEGRAMMNKALIAYDSLDFGNAFVEFEKSQKILERVNDKEGLASLLRYRGRAYLDEGQYVETLPQKTLDKIFQPFFTTKPTGEGTGLGLSLAYDIIKAHGGEIKVNWKEGEGSEFIIQLPA